MDHRRGPNNLPTEVPIVLSYGQINSQLAANNIQVIKDTHGKTSSFPPAI
jgi:hypothetical protein